jgi:hypothetical protein
MAIGLSPRWGEDDVLKWIIVILYFYPGNALVKGQIPIVNAMHDEARAFRRGAIIIGLILHPIGCRLGVV